RFRCRNRRRWLSGDPEPFCVRGKALLTADRPCREVTCDFAGELVDVARNLALWRLGAAPRLQRTAPAVVDACEIADHAVAAHMTGSGQLRARWAHMQIAHLVVDEVLAREEALLLLLLVDHRNERPSTRHGPNPNVCSGRPENSCDARTSLPI